MKKLIATLLGILTTTGLSSYQAFAFEVNSNASEPVLVSSNSLENMELDKEEKNSTLIIEGKEITIKSSKLKIINNSLMVPLKYTAESLGFKVIVNKDSAKIDNNEITSTITVGEDLYFYASSRAIGMTAPESLGAAPIMENNTIYVPIQMYNMLYNDSKAVGTFKCLTDSNKEIYIVNGNIAKGWNKINSNWYYMTEDGKIKTGWIKDKNNWYFLYDNGVMASDTVTPDGYKVDSSGKWNLGNKIEVQVMNPIVKYKTLKEAEKAVNFQGTLPSYISQNYNISVISNKILQILYKNNDNEILFRMSKSYSGSDLSGDYNVYEKEEKLKSGDLEVKVKENNQLVFIAEWVKANMIYSINISNGIEKDELFKIIGSIK